MRTMSVEMLNKFESYVRKDENGCWYWLGTCTGTPKRAYFRKVPAARWAMHLYRAFDLDSNLQINHKSECQNAFCVNPSHLYVGTQKENMNDRVKDGVDPQLRKTHCPQGHEYTEENIYYQNKSERKHRKCKICMSIQSKKRSLKYYIRGGEYDVQEQKRKNERDDQ